MASTSPKKSIVDRSVVSILRNPDDTPSYRDGIMPDIERKHRLYGTSLLSAACHLLKLEDASTFATACVIFHRFYHRVSLTQYCVWSVAMASLLLATKVEDGPQQRNVRTLILTFDHLYRKRRGCLKNGEIPEQKRVLPMPKLGPVWEEYYEHVLEMENRILRELGFTLYWIPDSHPHKFLWEFLRLLFQLEARPISADEEEDGPKTANGEEGNSESRPKEDNHHDLAQRAWNYCNDSHRLDLCVRFDSEVITCAAIHLAAIDLNLVLPTQQPRPWWELFLEDSKSKDSSNNSQFGQKVSTAANAILGLIEHERTEPSHQSFLPSLVTQGSFNDPDSFLWESRGIVL